MTVKELPSTQPAKEISIPFSLSLSECVSPAATWMSASLNEISSRSKTIRHGVTFIYISLISIGRRRRDTKRESSFLFHESRHFMHHRTAVDRRLFMFQSLLATHFLWRRFLIEPKVKFLSIHPSAPFTRTNSCLSRPRWTNPSPGINRTFSLPSFFRTTQRKFHPKKKINRPC